jgi:aspartate kinase
MVVMKFGGTSVGTSESIRLVASAIESQPGNKLVVLSANAGVTDALIELIGYLPHNQSEAKNKLKQISLNVFSICDDLELKDAEKEQIQKYIAAIEKLMEGIALLGFISEKVADKIVSFGERISTSIFYSFYSKNHKCSLLDITDHLIYNKVDGVYLLSSSDDIKNKLLNSGIIITQGFICKNNEGKISNLGRGGSDYSASILAAELGAEELQIWTDVSGVMTADPKIIKNAKTKDYVNITNLSKMAFFGAKVIHPDTLKPTMKTGIPVSIRNTFQASEKVTHITEGRKDNNPAITIKKGCYVYTLVSKSKEDLYLTNKYMSSLVVKHNLNLLTTFHSDDTVSYVYEKNIDDYIEINKSISSEKIDLLYICELNDIKINVILKNINKLNPKRIDLDLDKKTLLLLTSANNKLSRYSEFHDLLLDM